LVAVIPDNVVEGRTDATIRAVVKRVAMGKDRSSAAPLPEESSWRATACQRPQGAGRDSVDVAQRRSLARPAGRVPVALDLLAAVAGLGGAGRLAEYLARVPEGTQRAPATAVERIVLGR